MLHSKIKIQVAKVCILMSFAVMSAMLIACSGVSAPSKKELIKNFYLTEAAVLVSPHHLRKAMMKGKSDFTLVDLRSAEEYRKAHIKGALNIPAYSSPDKSAYDQVERIVGAFRELPQDKDIIVYCYSEPCMTGRKIGKVLAEHGIYVRHLGVGWNEWRYHWTTWNHEHEWSQTKVEDYVTTDRQLNSSVQVNGAHSSANDNRKGSLDACVAESELGC
ncbi:rhodanese-like domain-containing protein [bacterium]|nr:rhodanese-like domain-containing protein [bacterium]